MKINIENNFNNKQNVIDMKNSHIIQYHDSEVECNICPNCKEDFITDMWAENFQFCPYCGIKLFGLGLKKLNYKGD